MDAHRVSDAELLEAARGMAYDTATLLEDVARRLPVPHSVHVRNVATNLRRTADTLEHAEPTTDPPPSG